MMTVKLLYCFADMISSDILTLTTKIYEINKIPIRTKINNLDCELELNPILYVYHKNLHTNLIN